MFDELTKTNLLYDFYGVLLTEKQRRVMTLYHEENLSLSEIATEFQISRQGVHDALKSSEKALSEYENKLGLVKKFDKVKKTVDRINITIEGIIKNEKLEEKLEKELLTIKASVDSIND